MNPLCEFITTGCEEGTQLSTTNMRIIQSERFCSTVMATFYVVVVTSNCNVQSVFYLAHQSRMSSKQERTSKPSFPSSLLDFMHKWQSHDPGAVFPIHGSFCNSFKNEISLQSDDLVCNTCNTCDDFNLGYNYGNLEVEVQITSGGHSTTSV